MKFEDFEMLGVDTSKLIPFTSGYILRVSRYKDDKTGKMAFEYSEYVPGLDGVQVGVNNLTKEELYEKIEDTIERMKIGQFLLKEFLEEKRDDVCYWEEDQ